MKVTTRRRRSDSASAAVAAAKAAALGPLSPPAHVTLRPIDRPFWDAIVLARPRDTWNEADLATAANLARTQADIETVQAQLDADGLLLDGKPHPGVDMLDKMTRRALAMARGLMVHTQATVGRAQNIGKGAELERQARQEYDDLIPTMGPMQ